MLQDAGDQERVGDSSIARSLFYRTWFRHLLTHGGAVSEPAGSCLAVVLLTQDIIQPLQKSDSSVGITRIHYSIFL